MVCKRLFIANCIKSKGHSYYIISTLLPLPSLQAPPRLCSTILCHHPRVQTKLALLPHIDSHHGLHNVHHPTMLLLCTHYYP